MIETPRITHSPEQLTAVIRLTIPRDEIHNVMGPGIGELMATLATQGIAPAGRVKPGILPAAKVARTVYHGGYEGLGAAWGEFEAWIAAQGLATGPDFWECYVVGPESGPDPAEWRTQLNRPLIG